MMRRVGRIVRGLLPSLDRDDALAAIGLTGLICVSVGAGAIYPPAYPIVPGTLMLAFFVWKAR